MKTSLDVRHCRKDARVSGSVQYTVIPSRSGEQLSPAEDPGGTHRQK